MNNPNNRSFYMILFIIQVYIYFSFKHTIADGRTIHILKSHGSRPTQNAERLPILKPKNASDKPTLGRPPHHVTQLPDAKQRRNVTSANATTTEKPLDLLLELMSNRGLPPNGRKSQNLTGDAGNETLPPPSDIMNILNKTYFWDYLHAVQQRSPKRTAKDHHLLPFVKRNAYAIILAVSACCLVLALMVIGIVWLSEKRFGYRRVFRGSEEDGQIVAKGGSRNAGGGNSKRSKLNPRHWYQKDQIAVAKDSSRDAGGGNSKRSKLKNSRYGHKEDQVGARDSERNAGNKRKLSNMANSRDIAKEHKRNSRGETKRLKSTVDHLDRELSRTIEEGCSPSTDDAEFMTSQPSSSMELTDKIVAAGNSEPVDQMLTSEGWYRSYYTAQGLKHMSQQGPVELLEAGSESGVEEKPDGDASTAIPPGKDSIESTIGKFIDTAEWIGKQPRPASNSELKRKFRRSVGEKKNKSQR